MPEWVRFALAGLAAYRLAQLVVIDDGPLDLFQRMRDAAGVYDRDQRGRPMTALGRLLGCPYCIGAWLALACAAAAIWPTLIGDVLLAWWGVAGLAAYLQGERRVR